MENGIYSLRLLVGAARTSGLVVLRDRCLNGGDTERIFQGIFSQHGSQIRGALVVTKWNDQGSTRSFDLSLEAPVSIALSGTTDAGGFHMVGLGQAGVIVEVSGHRVAPLLDQCGDPPDGVVHELKASGKPNRTRRSRS